MRISKSNARALAPDPGRNACVLTANGVQIPGGNGYVSDYGKEKRMSPLRRLEYFEEMRYRSASAVSMTASTPLSKAISTGRAPLSEAAPEAGKTASCVPASWRAIKGS